MHGDRVLLRDWERGDAPAIEPVCGDWDVCQFTTVPWRYTPGEARAWIQRLSERRDAGSGLALAIVETGGHRPVGNVNLVRFSETRHEAALGYWLLPSARGRGLATTAARILSEWGFQELGLERVELAILPENAASHTVASRLGATCQGLQRGSHLAGGRPWDMIVYSLDRSSLMDFSDR